MWVLTADLQENRFWLFPKATAGDRGTASREPEPEAELKKVERRLVPLLARLCENAVVHPRARLLPTQVAALLGKLPGSYATKDLGDEISELRVYFRDHLKLGKEANLIPKAGNGKGWGLSNDIEVVVRERSGSTAAALAVSVSSQPFDPGPYVGIRPARWLPQPTRKGEFFACAEGIAGGLEWYVPRRLGKPLRRVAPKEIQNEQSRWQQPRAVQPQLRQDEHTEVMRQDHCEYHDSSEDEALSQIYESFSSDDRTWLVLGEPGAGKSTLLEWWATRLMQRLPEEAGSGLILPVLVRFRRLGELKETQDALIEQLWNERVPLVANDAHQRDARAARYIPLWLLDGWDEANTRTHDSVALARLHRLPGVKVISCRHSVYRARLEPQLRARIRQERQLIIRELNAEERLSVLKAILKNPAEAAALHAAIERSAALKFICGSAVILAFAAQLHRAGKRLLPASRYEFYGRVFAHRWERKSQPLDATGRYADRALQELAHQLATMQTHDFGPEEFADAVELGTPHASATVLLRRLVRVGILREFPAEGDTTRLEFVHESFQEYYLARRWLCTKQGTEAGFETALRQHWMDPKYDEALAIAFSGFLSGSMHRAKAKYSSQVVLEFVAWGKKEFAANPRTLAWPRSPLRSVLHLLKRAGLDTAQHASRCVLDEISSLVNGSEYLRLIIARDTNSPAALLAASLGDCEVLRWALASNANSPANLLAELAKDERVRPGVASNLSTPPSVLASLADDKEGVVREFVADNPSTPHDVLAKLAQDERVRESVARNPSTPPDLLAQLAQDERERVRESVASNPSTPHDVLAKLAQDERVRESVARNPSTPPDLLTQMAQDGRVRGYVLMNPSTPSDLVTDLLTEMAKDGDLRLSVASNPRAPADLLAEMAKDVYVTSSGSRGAWGPFKVAAEMALGLHVRYAVASNPSTPTNVLAELANDESVQTEVARNPSTSADVLARLGKSREMYVLCYVASHPNTPGNVIADLADDLLVGPIYQQVPLNRGGRVYWDAREILAANPKTPANVLAELAKHEDLRMLVADNSGLLLEALDWSR